jgi:hypothetical protein
VALAGHVIEMVLVHSEAFFSLDRKRERREGREMGGGFGFHEG